MVTNLRTKLIGLMKLRFQKVKMFCYNVLLVYSKDKCKVSIVADASDIAVVTALKQKTDGCGNQEHSFSVNLTKLRSITVPLIENC